MSTQREYRPRPHSRSLVWIILVMAAATLFATGLGYWENYKRITQMQNDPRVARVWLAGTTFGKEHILKRGSTLHRWLNDHNITYLGSYDVLQSQFSGDPSGLELWFNYESYLIGHPDLECHRITPAGTAFTDDLGQPYHGYLDIHGKTIGVYLPGYDHAAKTLYCVLHWVPRQPAPPLPVSKSMVFTVNLPPVKRVLPPSSNLPRGPVSLTKEGITVTADAARLGAPKLGSQATGQRDLTFRLRIDGGRLANDNVADEMLDDDSSMSSLPFPSPGTSFSTRAAAILRKSLSRQIQINTRAVQKIVGGKSVLQLLSGPTSTAGNAPLTITDPYGVSLIVPQQLISSLISKETVESARRGEGSVWVAPVNGAGRGTDVIKLHFDVLPNPTARGAAAGAASQSVPFDLLLPVQTGDEI